VALIGLVEPFMRTPEQGANTAVYLAASSEMDGVSGVYFTSRTPRRTSKRSYDREVAARLWAASARLAGLPPTEEASP
jgi:hypothetical protein